MGWLFGRKKKVPFPEPQKIDEKELKFPTTPHSDKVIVPEQLKEVAGVKKVDEPVPSPEPSKKEKKVALATPEFNNLPAKSPVMEETDNSPMYIKIQVYQRVLGELDELKDEISSLSHVSKNLTESEFNEDKHFEKLKKEIKSIHDNLLKLDKVLFKS
jgi:hypothetical protein